MIGNTTGKKSHRSRQPKSKTDSRADDFDGMEADEAGELILG